MFDRVRAGEEQLQAIAEGCLSLLRELIKSSTAATTSSSSSSSSSPSSSSAAAAMAGGKPGGRRSRKGGQGGSGGSSAIAARLDASERSCLLAGLKSAFALLMETDSHSLVQVS